MNRKIEDGYTAFLKIMACSECGWHGYPGYIPEMIDKARDCCPGCGNLDIKLTVGKFQYREITSGFIFKHTKTKYLKFVLKTEENVNSDNLVNVLPTA